MTAGPKITLDPAARLPFASPVVLSNIAAEHGETPATVNYEVGHAPAVELDGRTIEGPLPILRTLTECYAKAGLAGTKEDAAVINSFLVQSDSLGSAPFPVASQAADDLDQHLALRTFLVGHEITAADVAIWGAIRSSPPMLGIVKKLAHTHLARWYTHVDSLPPFTNALQSFNEAKSNMFKQKKTAAGFDLFLKGAKEGQVVTRFPPEASGYLHIGHAKAAILNQYFAREYKGKLIVRFDDTNPSKEKQEFEDSIVEDLALLGIEPDQVTHTSDYFEQLHSLAVKLIKNGKAYADDTAQEEMRAQRMEGLPSARRDATVEENLARFDEMNTGSPEGSRWCLRAKMSVDNPNKAMRDPVIYRCNGEIPHARTGSTWKVYPTYDFACPVVDSMEGITHALRSNEYHDRNPQYAWMLEALGMRGVEIWDFGRMNFVYTLLSKRKLQWFVDHGMVSGWDDPRFPTVRGIRRRGMTIDCIRQFMLSQGPSQQIINMEWDNIWALNKRLIDPVVPRYTALEENGIVPASISGVSFEEKTLPCHKKNADLGTKTTVFGPEILFEQADAASFEEGEEVTLMDWGNAIIRKKQVGPNGVERLELEAHLDGDFKQTKKKVTWLAASSEKNQLTPVTLLDFDYLITKKKLEEEDNFTDFLTPQSIFVSQAIADKNVATLEKGTQIQFERKGYYILDDTQGADGRRVFIRIPDGKAASSASKAAPDENPEQKKAAAAAARAQKAAEKAKKAEKKAEKGGGKAAGAPALNATEQLVQNGVKRVNMYNVPKVNEDVEVPVKTSMYHVKPITE